MVHQSVCDGTGWRVDRLTSPEWQTASPTAALPGGMCQSSCVSRVRLRSTSTPTRWLRGIGTSHASSCSRPMCMCVAAALVAARLRLASAYSRTGGSWRRTADTGIVAAAFSRGNDPVRMQISTVTYGWDGGTRQCGTGEDGLASRLAHLVVPQLDKDAQWTRSWTNASCRIPTTTEMTVRNFTHVY